jgi:pimeloyl-ACP methyl ester carboxylesterase
MATPFKIDVSDEIIGDLHHRLAKTRWPDEIIAGGWEYGTDLAYMKEFCKYWEKYFDWPKQQTYLNTFHHYRAETDGFGLHYIHEKGKGPDPLPLLLIHGYPDSFARFLKLIPLLTETDSNGLSFDVVVPSLPGFGFSDKPREKGMNPEKIAGMFVHLMEELGYPRFAAHGGDWGSSIIEQLAFHYPGTLTGIHLTDIPYKHIFTIPSGQLSDAEKQYLENGKQWSMQEGAYAMIQGTKPQTLAYAVNDSPAGLAAWIIEKFRSWSDSNGDIESRFTKDELLIHIMIYWVTQTANSAFRIYYESMHMPPEQTHDKPEVPAALAVFPKDLVPAPRDFAERLFDVKQFTEMPAGGHFSAMEEPALLAADIRKFLSSL